MAKSGNGIFDSPVCVAVTGAGRGFGSALCMALVENLLPGSALLLLGRKLEDLRKTRDSTLAVSRQIEVHMYDSYDCQSLDSQSGVKLTAFLLDLRGTLQLRKISSMLLIHNAGTVGSPDTPSSLLSYSTVSTYMDVNFSAMISTNNMFLDVFSNFCTAIVQITSLCAVKPFKSLSLYCAGR